MDDERIVQFLELAGVVIAHSFKAVFLNLKHPFGYETTDDPEYNSSVFQSSLLRRTGGLDEEVDWNW